MEPVVTIAEFKNRLKATGYAESTIEGYSKNLDLFTRYLEDQAITDLRRVTHRLVLDYQEKVMAEPISTETKALKIRPVKRLFEHLAETNRLLVNPTEGIIETPRRRKKLGPVLTVAEMKRLLSQPNLSLRSHIRDRAILEVLYSTGVRLGELLHLEVYHADLKEGVLYIRKAKGRRERVVPLGKEAIRYLKEYLEKIRPHYGRKNPKERKLFLNHSGRPLTPESVRGAIREYRLRARIRKPVSPHTLRRTCATHLLQQGADVRHIQKLLGHARLETTQVYTKVMPVEVKRTHEKTHPNAGDRGSGVGDEP